MTLNQLIYRFFNTHFNPDLAWIWGVALLILFTHKYLSSDPE
jgi:hypothetical protein